MNPHTYPVTSACLSLSVKRNQSQCLGACGNLSLIVKLLTSAEEKVLRAHDEAAV